MLAQRGAGRSRNPNAPHCGAGIPACKPHRGKPNEAGWKPAPQCPYDALYINFAKFVCVPRGLKGRHMLAQGNALG